jgi:hypothetical protein
MIEWIPAPTQDGAVVRVDAGEHDAIYRQGRAPGRRRSTSSAAGTGTDRRRRRPGLRSWLVSDRSANSFESQLIRNVHVIGDACIADAMPKSASAAVSQAHQCARAIVALLAGRDPAPPAFDSVCYSMVAPQRALAIHGHFAIEAGSIVALAPLPDSDAGANVQQALAAQRWYRAIRADAFGD